MFSKEFKYISDLNLNKLKAIGDKITIDELKKSKVHPALTKYIEAGLDKEIINDKKRIENESVFDYRNDRIYEYFMLIGEEIKRTHNFDLEFLKSKLSEAINFNIKYLISPNKTLTNFIFDKTDSKSIEEILVDLSHLHYYKYLQKILFTYLDKKQVLSLKRNEFTFLLNKIDQVSKETHKEETIITAINSMANFFDPQANNSRTVPLNGIREYLKEKRLTEYLEKVNQKYTEEANVFIPIIEITSIIKSVIPESEITIEESKDPESDFVLDEKNENNLENLEASENGEDIFIHEENNQELSDDLLNIEDSEEDIPDDEILSDDENKVSNSFELNDNEKDNSPLTEEDIEEKDKKKKEIIKNLVNKHINLTKLYDDVLPLPKPFSEKTEIEEIQNAISSLSDQSNYIIDLSELEDEIEVEETEVFVDEFAKTDLKESKMTDDENTETELISDLDYLNNKSEELEEKVQTEEEVHSKENIKLNFADKVKDLDMSPIIGSIFDYDMEEYKEVLNKIDLSNSEDEALNSIADYCRDKKIEQEMSEVKYFKKIISNHFTKKIYS